MPAGMGMPVDIAICIAVAVAAGIDIAPCAAVSAGMDIILCPGISPCMGMAICIGMDIGIVMAAGAWLSAPAAGALEHWGATGAASLAASTIWLMTGANTMSHMASRPSQAVIEVRLPRVQ
jgi:hypothetical protein